MDPLFEVQKIHYKRLINPGFVGVDFIYLARQISFTYLWMALGVFISMLTALVINKCDDFHHCIVNSKPIYYSLIAAQFIAVCTLASISKTCGKAIATLLYLLYSILVGATLSVIFLQYQLVSVIQTFACTMISFVVLSAFGLVTRRSLHFIGTFCLTGLAGLVVLGLMFMLWPNLYTATAQWCWSAAGVIVLCGLTAYDSQQLKTMLIAAEHKNPRSGTINAALFLYLDFINLFLNLLHLFGRKK